MNKLRMTAVLMLFAGFWILFGPRPGTSEGASEGGSYIIGLNDILFIHVWKEPDLTAEIAVMHDGKITFPLIGEVVVAGRSLEEVRASIAEKLKKFVSNPVVTVILRESRSRQIFTIGKLNQPGPLPMKPHMTVLQALSSAGGFQEWAETKDIVILRRDGEREILIPFNYNDVVSGKRVEQNILLRPDDTIVVP